MVNRADRPKWLLRIARAAATAAIAVFSITTTAVAQEITLSAYAKMAGIHGYTANVSKNLTGETSGLVVIKLVKSGDTTEEYGLLGVKWKRRETHDLLYYPVGGVLLRVHSKAVVETKAPMLFGKWRVDEVKTVTVKLPVELDQPRLHYPPDREM